MCVHAVCVCERMQGRQTEREIGLEGPPASDHTSSLTHSHPLSPTLTHPPTHPPTHPLALLPRESRSFCSRPTCSLVKSINRAQPRTASSQSACPRTKSRIFIMDWLIGVADEYVLDSAYASLPHPVGEWFAPRDNQIRQIVSLWLILTLGGTALYFIGAGTNYYFFFDQETKKNPKYLKNQIAREIYLSLESLPWTAVVTVPWFFFELRGYSKLYDTVTTWWEIPVQLLGFLAFTDCFVYWIHRGFHHPAVYPWLHKPHHVWKVTTPFAAIAFHYLDGYGQSIPYHVYVYLFPMWKPLYLALFVFVQLWTISIHDGVYLSNDGVLLSAAHHNVHHLEFNYNYGQYTTLWDRIGGSYKKPVNEYKNEMFFDKLRRRKAAAATAAAAAAGAIDKVRNSTETSPLTTNKRAEGAAGVRQPPETLPQTKKRREGSGGGAGKATKPAVVGGDH
ncbi:hypothetical protein DFJ73DRAFT_853512 [Zopfochytrium polystomum]|nr:hypothetical protein DFJ73DRAFT_853512 [Zopfochytrium polystomum]